MVAQFKENNIDILDIFYCPHKPESNCECRKPNPGMILKAREIYNIDLQKSWIIGDKENDIIAGYNAGIQKTVIVRSGHNINESSSTALHIIDSIKDIDKVILQ